MTKIDDKKKSNSDSQKISTRNLKHLHIRYKGNIYLGLHFGLLTKNV